MGFGDRFLSDRRVRSVKAPCALLLIVAVAVYPLRDPRFYHTHDGFEHVFRILAFSSAIREGDILPRWVPELAGGFGYPLFFIYSPLAYYLPALLALAHIPVLTAVKIDLVLLIGATAVGAYVAARSLTRPLPAVVGTAAYVCAPYTLANVYLRLDLAELSAFPLAAFALAALLRLAQQMDTSDTMRATSVWRWGSIAAVTLSLMAATHSLSLLIFVPVAVPVGIWTVGRGKPSMCQVVRRGMVLLGVVSLAACLSAWFLVPALQWQTWVRLSAIPGDGHFYGKLISIPGMLSSLARDQRWFVPGGSLWFLSVVSGPSGEVLAGPSYASLAAALMVPCIVAVRGSRRRGEIAACTVALLVCIVLTTRWSEPLWSAVPRLTQVQFPWRFMGPISLLVALLSAAFVNELPARLQPVAAGLLLVATLLPPMLLILPAYQDVEGNSIRWPTQLRREFHQEFGTTGTGLFLPRTVTASVPGEAPSTEDAVDVATDRIHIVSFTLGRRQMTMDYTAEAPVTFTVGRITAPAWGARLDGAAVAVHASPRAGLQQVQLPGGDHHLQISLRPTALSLIARAISAVALAFTLRLLLTYRPAGAVAHLVSYVVPVCVVAVFLLAGPALSWFRSDRSPWLPPSSPPLSMVAPAIAWKAELRPDWDTTPVVHIAFLVNRTPTAPQTLAIRASTVGGSVVWEGSQAPRFGNFDPKGWMSNLVFDDFIRLPNSTLLCGGDYQLEIAWTSPDRPNAWQGLGRTTLPGQHQDGCDAGITDRSGTGPAVRLTTAAVRTSVGGYAQTLHAGDDVHVEFTLAMLRHTEDDERIRVVLVDGAGRYVVRHDSDTSVDLIFSSLWRKGGTLHYRTVLRLPSTTPAGLYDVRVGLVGEKQKGFSSDLENAEGIVPQDRMVGLQRVTVAGPRLVTDTERVVFGGTIGLLDARLSNVHAGPVAPGSTVNLDFQWIALKPPDADYTLFLQLLDSQGKLVAQHDGPPQGGTYPTSAWDVGSAIGDLRELILPASLPDGTYRVIIGWYHPITGTRLQVAPSRPDDAWEVATIRVGS